MGLGFLLPLSRGVAEASHTARRAEAKKEGWRLCFRGRLSPARMTTRKCPHGVYKHTRNDRLGQSLFTAARRLWTLFVSRRRSAGAFFCALVVRFRACRSVSPGSRVLASFEACSCMDLRTQLADCERSRKPMRDAMPMGQLLCMALHSRREQKGYPQPALQSR